MSAHMLHNFLQQAAVQHAHSLTSLACLLCSNTIPAYQADKSPNARATMHKALFLPTRATDLLDLNCQFCIGLSIPMVLQLVCYRSVILSRTWYGHFLQNRHQLLPRLSPTSLPAQASSTALAAEAILLVSLLQCPICPCTDLQKPMVDIALIGLLEQPCTETDLQVSMCVQMIMLKSNAEASFKPVLGLCNILFI